MILISNLKIGIEDNMQDLTFKIRKKLKLKDQRMQYKIVRESIDARKKGKIDFVYQVLVEVDDPDKILKSIKDPNVKEYKKPEPTPLKKGHLKKNGRVLVVGSGPAGLFAAYTLAENGYKPILIERGKCIEERSDDVEKFWRDGILDPKSNVQFGEGGAGTFSDGKLTTRIKDNRVSDVLEIFHSCGAPEEILYAHKPHIGTDVLRNVVINMRKRIIEMGAEVRFESMLEKIEEKDGHISGAWINSEYIEVSALILAIGHSARETYKMLDAFGVKIIAKPFAVGFRVEHPQQMVNRAQYKEFYNHPRLGAADYQLTYKSDKYERSAYTFCMCPGGLVIGSSSNKDELVVNGMSYHARNLENANSALLVSVSPKDFKAGALSGIEFQKKFEKMAFELGGGKYKAPVQRVEDFLKSEKTKAIGRVRPSYNPGFTMADLSKVYDKDLTNTLKDAILDMDKKLKGFAHPDAILTGVETRSSSPVRVVRDELTFESESIKGLYPSGEGAGYAGGIVSSAVDGIKSAQALIAKYKPQV